MENKLETMEMQNVQKAHRIRCYCMNLRYASNILTKYYDQAFAPLHITANQFFLLNSIRTLEACNKSELARYTRLERTTIIRNLDVLFKKELITQKTEGTRRRPLICLTDSGQSVTGRGLPIWEGVQRKVEECFGKEDLQAFWHMLERVESLKDSSER